MGEAGGRVRPPAPESLDQRQRDRRERIIAAAVDAILRNDYSDIQVKDVTAAAGVALATTYHYFASKEHLVAEALWSWSERYGDDLRDDLRESADGSSADRLKAAFRRAVRAFERHPTVYGNFLVLQATTEPSAAEVFSRFGARQRSAFGGVLPGVPDDRRADIVHVMGAVLDTNLREWSRGRQDIAAVYRAVDRTAELLLPT